MSEDAFEELDAAYVFGALGPDEAARFETHLATCADCANRVAELRGIVSVLDGISPEEILAPAPETLLPGLLRRAAQSRRRQRWLVGGLASVAAACLVTLIVVLLPSSGTSQGSPIAMSAVAASPVSATVRLDSTHSGTTIRLHCTYNTGTYNTGTYNTGTYNTGSYADGSGGAAPYALVVVDRDKTAHELSTWTLAPGQEGDFQASTALPESQIATIEVTYQNQPILTAAP